MMTSVFEISFLATVKDKCKQWKSISAKSKTANAKLKHNCYSFSIKFSVTTIIS
jgi:hypothetical protein